MIGASSSPMSMFGGVGTGSGPSMYEIGYNGSPGGAVSNALRATIDKYHATLASQQDQQNKIGLLDHEAALKRSNVVPDPDANGPQIMKDSTTGKFFYGNSTVDPSTGAIKKSWTPVTNSPPTDEKKVFENSLYSKINAGMNEDSAAPSPIPGVPPAPTVVGQGTAPQSRPLDAGTATQLLQQAGGDKNKARAMAQQLGYTF